MKNVTITLDEETANWARTKAAAANQSLSRWIGELIRSQSKELDAYDRAMRSWMAQESANISDGKPYPKREELYDRPRIR